MKQWLTWLADALTFALSPARREQVATAPEPPADDTETRIADDDTPPPPVPAPQPEPLAADDAERVNALIDRMLKHEGAFDGNGGWQRWKSDRGNWHKGELLGTKYGIIPDRLAEWRGTNAVTLDDMRNLTLEEARQIYRSYYYEKPKIHLLPDAIEPVVFDLGVNAGPSRGIKELQQVLTKAGFRCGVDGRIGPETVNQAFKAHRAMGGYLINAYCDERIAFYEAIIRNRPANAKFRRGWHRRANSYRVDV